MHLRDYQLSSSETDQSPTADEKGLVVPLLGLAGEVGSLLTEYKKHLRDGNAHRLFREQIREDLGDLLWYVANVATKFGLDLEEIAAKNLKKTQDRWPVKKPPAGRLFDENYPAQQKLPRQFEIRIREEDTGGRRKVVCRWDGK